MIWKEWDKEKPSIGDKVVIVCNDGCSTAAALIGDADGEGGLVVMHAEDGWNLNGNFVEGALWALLPDSYVIAFTQDDGRP